MGYYVDLHQLTLEEYHEKLKTADLLPSRKILQEGLDENFKRLSSANISNCEELITNPFERIKKLSTAS